MVVPAMSGVHAALATPVDAAGALDVRGLGRLLDRIRATGVSTVCPTGSTGEGPRLSRDQRQAVVAAVREHAGDALRVVPAPVGQAPGEVLAELRGFADLGAHAALVPPPSYFPMDDTEVRRYYETLVEGSPLPLLLYNIPMNTGVPLAPGVVAELAQRPDVIGLKDSSRDFEYFQAVVTATADIERFAVLTGTDTMLVASLAAGGHGAIAASVNVVPGLSKGIERSMREGDRHTTERLQRRVQDIVAVCRTGSPPAGWKAALEHVGVCSRRLVPPGSALDDRQYDVLCDRLSALGVDADGAV